METRILGRGAAALPVSAIGLGCMGMSEFYGASDDAQSLHLLAQALELGFGLFDTADTYGHGHNEDLLARFMRQDASRRGRMVIASKFGIVREPGKYARRIDNRPPYIRSACEASLKRLGVDCIDLYYCHRRNPEVPVEDVVGTLAELVQAGKIRTIGLSEVSTDTLRRAHAVHPVTAVQSEYSLWTRDAEQSLLPVCTELGVGFVPYSPLGRAFLTGAVSARDLPDGDLRKHLPRFQGEAEAANRQLVQQLGGLCNRWGLSNAQTALAWMLHKHPNLVPIPGTRQLAYLRDNASAATVRLDAEQMRQLDALFDPARIAGARYAAGDAWVGIETPPV